MKRLMTKETTLFSSMDYKRPKYKIIYFIMLALLIIMSVICFFPVIWIALSCFKDVKEFYSTPPTLLPKHIDLSMLVKVWNKLGYLRYYLNTLCIAAGNLVVCIISTGFAGYVLSKLKPKGWKLVLSAILWTMLLPSSVSMVPLFMSFVDFPIIHANLTNTYLPLWMMAGANTFYMLVFKNFFDSISVTLVEAARVDGCSDAGIFFKIIAPLSKSVIMVIAIFTFNDSWGSFLWPYLVVKSESMFPVMVRVFTMSNSNLAMNEYLSALFFAILPPVILFLCFSKQIMTGFSLSGGVKE